METKNGSEGIQTNTAFERTEVDSNLLADGEQIYVELNGDLEGLGQKLEDLGVEFNETVFTLMMEECRKTLK
ncbi:hypothetical protein KKG65_00605 [Patescibacteria group bacterium]|nr:hypothetical protein [Patescibacteria group bacterium]